jgi:hypothetical protein
MPGHKDEVAVCTHGLTFRVRAPPGVALSIPTEISVTRAATNARRRTAQLVKTVWMAGTQDPIESTRDVGMKRSEDAVAIWMTVETTAMKTVRLCQSALRSVERTDVITTMTVEMIVANSHAGLDIPPSGGLLIHADRLWSSSRTATAITNAMVNGSAAPTTAAR